MSVDTPAKIAVLGAGPIGLEAALYARFLGYDVEIFDRGGVAESVQRWGHVRMFSPFRMNSTPLGLAALTAQDETYRPPDPDALLTGREWKNRYLIPLSQTDLLSDQLRLHHEVLAVTRCDLLKQELIGQEDRADSLFRIVVRQGDGQELDFQADVVIDATGVFHNPNWCGPGGAPAWGESASNCRLRYDIPDLSAADRKQYANRRVLVIGSGHSAATTVAGLVDLATQETAGRIVWVTRRALADDAKGPLNEIPGDSLALRAELTQRVNRIVATEGPVVHWPATLVQSAIWDEARRKFTVRLIGQHAGTEEFDEIIANVGYRPDNKLYAELQVHECYATSGPMKLAASLLRHSTDDCLLQHSHGPDSLRNPEPNFYVMGAKSYGRNSNFLVSVGHNQIREIFSIIGERATLDLYKSFNPPPSGLAPSGR